MDEMNLSQEAKSVLINGGLTMAPAEIVRELYDAGLVGERGGMTCKGVFARERLVNEALDKAFGR